MFGTSRYLAHKSFWISKFVYVYCQLLRIIYMYYR